MALSHWFGDLDTSLDRLEINVDFLDFTRIIPFMVNRDDYKAMLDKAVGELTEAQERRAELDAERDQLDARIAELKQGIIALGPLCGVIAQAKYADLLPEYSPVLPVGLKEAVLSLLALVPENKYVTPVGIRDGLTTTGYEIKSKNILPSIHNVLKRLKAATPPEVESTDLDGKTVYRLAKKEQIPAAASGIRPRTRGSLGRPLKESPLSNTSSVPPVPGADASKLSRPPNRFYDVLIKMGEDAEKNKK